MNFYESARFQYAAARLMVKLAQFREKGRFVKKITSNTNLGIQLVTQIDGSFNINVEVPDQRPTDEVFVKISVSDLIAYVSERIVEKIDEQALREIDLPDRRTRTGAGAADAALNQLVEDAMAGRDMTARLPVQVQDSVKRRVAEAYRERRLAESSKAISLIDFARSQKLISMSAPLISEMATALRQSAESLEITETTGGRSNSIFYLNREMAAEIETAIVDSEITPILGDITQFNKDNGWGKLKIENGSKIMNFSIPSDILPSIKATLIQNMQKDLVFLQTYFVRDPGGEVIRLIAVGILPTPTK
ncbi:hypothetical protein [Acidisphaera sp. S103]|uniref:hypothetical protein n=1 Tax=Acidisphaera sp. S103 TaxID=1747223 RepID=UPI001C2094B4|nr:hypothetical protein [Acidisphaera sp. S103]